ncbi:MAG TPA: ABC transporter permease, partial [Terriglobales bacterium]|nr:ABC transporter permease [Terriglobales bacterium]
RHILRIALTLLIGGLLAATLIRFAPGFDTDEQQMDARLSADSVAALRAQRTGQHNVLKFYAGFLESALRGDFGQSQTLNRPVRELVAERMPVTFKLVACGLLVGWSLALVFAVSATMARIAVWDLAATTVAGLLLCVPSAVLALAFVFFRAPGYLAVGLMIFANVFRYWRNLLEKSYAMPHIITARAKGLGTMRVLCCHVLPISGTQLLAVAGVSVSIALGTAIPVEALCGIPGIGQLAWQAAMGRDLSLLVTLTLLVTTITLLANTTSDLLGQVFRAQRA